MKEIPDFMKETPDCLYRNCKEISTCRAEDPEYHWQESHGRGYPKSVDGSCPSPFNHKYICDKHFDLLEFIRETITVKLDARIK